MPLKDCKSSRSSPLTALLKCCDALARVVTVLGQPGAGLSPPLSGLSQVSQSWPRSPASRSSKAFEHLKMEEQSRTEVVRRCQTVGRDGADQGQGRKRREQARFRRYCCKHTHHHAEEPACQEKKRCGGRTVATVGISGDEEWRSNREDQEGRAFGCR